MVLYFNKCRVTLVWHSCDLLSTAESLQEAAEMAKEALLSHFNQVAGNLRFKSTAPIARMPGGPGGGATSRHHVEVPGALLDAHWLTV